MEKRGHFLVIEGTDGSGKGEQSALLFSSMNRAGLRVAKVDFPQYKTPPAFFVEQHLNGVYGGANDVNPRLASVFYALDRFHASKNIREHLDSGGHVIANRYVASSLGHQGGKITDPEERRRVMEWIWDFEYNICGIPKPDLNIFLEVPLEISYELIEHKAEREYLQGKKRDIYEADPKHLANALAAYHDAIMLYPNDFVVIDCAPQAQLLSIDAIHKLILEVLPADLKSCL